MTATDTSTWPLNSRAAAELADISDSTFRAYVSRGQAPQPDGEIGGVKMWHRSTIEQWLASRGRGPGQRGYTIRRPVGTSVNILESAFTGREWPEANVGDYISITTSWREPVTVLADTEPEELSVFRRADLTYLVQPGPKLRSQRPPQDAQVIPAAKYLWIGGELYEVGADPAGLHLVVPTPPRVVVPDYGGRVQTALKRLGATHVWVDTDANDDPHAEHVFVSRDDGGSPAEVAATEALANLLQAAAAQAAAAKAADDALMAEDWSAGSLKDIARRNHRGALSRPIDPDACAERRDRAIYAMVLLGGIHIPYDKATIDAAAERCRPDRQAWEQRARDAGIPARPQPQRPRESAGWQELEQYRRATVMAWLHGRPKPSVEEWRATAEEWSAVLDAATSQ